MRKKVQLNKYFAIPALGLGTWQITGKKCTDAVSYALSQGYEHIDTADAYGNHKEVGIGIKESGVKREDFFLTTKVWRDKLRRDDVFASVERFLNELQTDYIDLLLIHWPNEEIPIKETLEAMQELQKDGTIKGLGVSNFTLPLLEEAIATGVHILNNQVEFHPTFNQKELKDFCDEKHIITTAYSPLAQGADIKLPIIQELSRRYNKTPAQIILNWILQKEMVAIPRSSDPVRIDENLAATTFSLTHEDILKVDEVHAHNRLIHPPFAPF